MNARTGNHPRPDPIFRQLVEAAARRDGEQLVSVCQENAQHIFDHFEEWRVVPESIRRDPSEVQRHFEALIETAKLFDRAGHSELLAMLAPPDEGNFFTQWQDRFVAIHRLSDAGHAADALPQADELLRGMDASGAAGPGFLDLRAKLNGLRSQIFVMLDRLADAQAAVALALADCERNGDAEGIRVYGDNLALLQASAGESTPETEAELELLEQFDSAQRLAEQGRFKASNELFATLLPPAAGPRQVLQDMEPHVMGRIGYNEYRLGNLQAARTLIESARARCAERGDSTSAEIYAENLRAAGGSGEPAEAGAGKPRGVVIALLVLGTAVFALIVWAIS